MKRKTSDNTDTHLKMFCIMCRDILDKTKSEYTHKMIFDILEEETKLGREQRYQAISKITDILNSTNSEQEIVEKLKKEYPQYS